MAESLVASIKGVICGVRIEAEIEELTMREIRYLDKLVDELKRSGWPMENPSDPGSEWGAGFV